MQRLLRKRREEEKHRKGAGMDHDRPEDPPKEPPGVRIERLVREGVSRKFARIAVLAPDHPLRCSCEVCG
jgi:hypothetical protein